MNINNNVGASDSQSNREMQKSFREFQEDLYQSIVEKLISRKNFSAFELMNALLSETEEKELSEIRRELNELGNYVGMSSEPTPQILEYIYRHLLHRAFPNSFEGIEKENLDKLTQKFLKCYQSLSDAEKSFENEKFYLKYPLRFLREEEEAELNSEHEYFKFKNRFRDEYVYEMLKLSQEIRGYSTLDHVSGVCFVALQVARALKACDLPIDLGIIVSATMGHDLGKYGVKPENQSRVAYLHYYYTNLWFEERRMPFSGKVAANHSTWDLEIENLSVESLILIFADFRVKANGKDMHIYDLDSSFQVILDKLDNVDSKKEDRYKRVYAKLKDFERFMNHLGICTKDPEASVNSPKETKDYALMYGDELVDSIKFEAIRCNINILKNFSTMENFNELLVKLSSEKNWRELRNYIELFMEYDKYLGKPQKLLLLNELKELLLFREEDVRNQAAEVIGIMIANYDEEYRKELPEEAIRENEEDSASVLLDRFLNYFLYKTLQQTEKNTEWLRINAKNMVRALFRITKKPEAFHPVIFKYLDAADEETDPEIVLALTQVLKHINLVELRSADSVNRFLLRYYDHPNIEVRLAISKLIYVMTKHAVNLQKDQHFAEEILSKTFPSKNKVVDLIRIMMLKEIGQRYAVDVGAKLSEFGEDDISEEQLMEIYLKNLKSATGLIEKKANVDVMVERIRQSKTKETLQAALHFCNLLKVSATETVRNHSGKSIIRIVQSLNNQEKNEVSIELIRALEMQDIQFAKYIPRYIGKLMIHLPMNELDEAVEDFYVKVKTASSQLVWLSLHSIGYLLEEYLLNLHLLHDSEQRKEHRLAKLIGILLLGLYNFDSAISNEALKILSMLFGSNRLSLERKYKLFRLIDKKLLIVLGEKSGNADLIYLKNSASLNKIYRFILDYEFFEGKLTATEPGKIAFFPGTFDPFSLGHKQIATEIRNQGYDVFLAIDEFSWSKKAQPHIIRKNIVKSSVADEMGIYIFPSQYPINIANDENILKLKELFPEMDLWIVVGSDVVSNASSYSDDRRGEILKLNHIIFERTDAMTYSSGALKPERSKIDNIMGEVNILSLPPQYELISSTQIREAVDEDRDISELIDLQAQNYIYRYNLYKKAPQYKFFAPRTELAIERIEHLSTKNMDRIIEEAKLPSVDIRQELFKSAENGLKVITVRNESDGKLIAFASGFNLKSKFYYEEMKDSSISEYLRSNALGRVFLVNSVWLDKTNTRKNLLSILMNELFAMAIEKDYAYCVVNNLLTFGNDRLENCLKLQGFISFSRERELPPVQIANISNPIVLNPDLRSIIKEPFRNNAKIREVIYRTREKLQSALTKLYPGELVLAFDRKVTYAKLVKKVCELNEVSYIQSKERRFGKKLCVSYGTILNDSIIPNTVTKALHTEKVFKSDLKSFSIEEYPNYLELSEQIETIKAFDRSVILIDDILHKGYRLQKMQPLLEKASVRIDNIVVAILSGRGHEIIQKSDQQVEYIYYIRSLRNWFNENSLYPFVGGDYVRRDGQKDGFLLPSLNYILPYAYPKYIIGARKEDIYHLSEVCIENAIEFFEAIESEYLRIYEKSFSLYKLREIFEKTRMPDYGTNLELDFNLKPSDYLKNDLERLRRLDGMCLK